MHGVTITELIEKMNLRNSTPQIDTDKIGCKPSGTAADRIFRSF